MRTSRNTLLASSLWFVLGLLVLIPAPLVWLARLFQAAGKQVPVLSVLGRAMPPRPLLLLLLLVGTVVAVSLVAATRELIGAFRLSRELRRFEVPAPPAVAAAARRLGLESRLTYLAISTSVAFCYGFLRPRVAITAGLIHRLDDEEELVAVLVHERHHMQRRDPLRYLVIRALSSGLFMIPAARAARLCIETRIELAADRAALAVVSPGALATALLAALAVQAVPSAGTAPLGTTEARIANLTWHQRAPRVTLAVGLATLGLVAGLGMALAWLASPDHVGEMVCELCAEQP
jgi:beta-lactamase regulating signal transducer with metallopeptidase domain